MSSRLLPQLTVFICVPSPECLISDVMVVSFMIPPYDVPVYLLSTLSNLLMMMPAELRLISHRQR